jgi:hypothetical protein
MAVLFTDNAESTLAGSITAGATDFTVASGDGAKFPSLPNTSTEYFYIRLGSDASNEVVKVMWRAGDTLYCEATANSWGADTPVVLTVCRQMLNEFLQGRQPAPIGGAALAMNVASGWGGDGYRVGVGWAYIQGDILGWGSALVQTDVGPANDTWYHVYVYDSGGGVAACEAVTTAPAWSTTYQYWTKNGDATRRYVGSLLGWGGGWMPFGYETVRGNNNDLIMRFLDRNSLKTLRAMTSSSTTPVSVSSYTTPTPTTEVQLLLDLFRNTTTARGYAGLSIGTSTSGPTVDSFPYQVQADGVSSLAGNNHVMTSVWAAPGVSLRCGLVVASGSIPTNIKADLFLQAIRITR